MKKGILVVLGIALLAVTAVAGDMTPEECMQKMMNCEACKPMNEYPQIGPNIRFDMVTTDKGFVSTFLLADESAMPAYDECEKKMAVTREACAKFTAEEAEAKLCPFCIGMRTVMTREDVTLNDYKVSLGSVMVATASTEEGVKALHAYAKDASHASDLLDMAVANMMKEQSSE